MSDFGLFEADHDAQNAPQRQAKIASQKLADAIYDVRDGYSWLLEASGKDDFEDRWHFAKADIRKTVEAAGLFPNTGTMRRVHNAMKQEFLATIGDDNADDPTKKPDNGGDKARTINDKQYKKVKDGDPKVKDAVETNTGDGSDAEGNDPSPTTGKQKDPRHSSLSGAPAQNLQEGREVNIGADLIPSEHNEYDTGESVEGNFGQGGDTGKDKGGHEARRIAYELYEDFAESNGLRTASRNTLEHYADTGIDDSTYFLLANMIHQAGGDDCECEDDDDSSEGSDDKDTDGPGGSDSDSDGPPSGAAEKGGESDDSESDSGESDSEKSDSEGSESAGGSDSGESSDSGDNPFGGEESGPPAEAGPPSPEGAPEDLEAPPGPPDLGPEDGGDPAGDLQAPPGPPDLSGAPPLAEDDFSGVDEFSPQDAGGLPPGTELVQVEQIEDALGLPPGTLEQILMEQAQGGASAGPPPGPGGPPPHMGRRKQSFGEQPAVAAPAPAAPAAAPAAPPMAESPAAPPNDALLDQASQAVTSLVDQKTQEYQTIIDPLQQALQAIQFAQQVEQAENPLDVTPPEGTVDATPGAAVDPAAAAAQGEAQAAAAAPPAAPAAPAPSGGGSSDSSSEKKESALRRHAYRIAHNYGLSANGYDMILAAMSRKHYQHVAEAIQTLPAEHRLGIAASLADMFHADNVRFNAGQFMASAGVPMGMEAVHMASNPADRKGDTWADGKDRRDKENEDYDTDPDNWEERTGSRRPFVEAASPQGGERWHTAGETWKPPGGGQGLDAFEFPNHGEKPQFDDNMKINDLPDLKTKGTKVGGVVDDYQKFDKHETQQGLNFGGEGEVDAFLERKKVGPRAQEKLHTTLGLQPHEKAASFFQKKVAGWRWDDHLNGYITDRRREFTCTTSGCGESVPTPSYGTCRCGKIWNTYAIGNNDHLASNEATMYIAREIPVREGVIMANRQFQAAEEEFNNESGDGPYQDYPEDVKFFEDDERDTAPTPHAPGETDMDTRKSAATYGDDDHNVVTRNGEKYCSACDAMLWDPNVHHCPTKQGAVVKLDEPNDAWKTHSDQDNAGYAGAGAPPQTGVGNTPKDWAKRGDGSKWLPPVFK